MQPKTKFCQVLISAELRTQGLRLLDRLLRKHLIFGGPVLSGPARFLWKNEIVEHDYCWARERAGAPVQGRRRGADLRAAERHPEADRELLGRPESGAARRSDTMNTTPEIAS